MIAVRNVQGLFKLNKTIMNLVRTAVLKASDVNALRSSIFSTERET
jgi:hypothetical protein